MKYSLKKMQKGLSLIELLVSMLIGLFLLAGIATSYLSSQKTSVERDEYSLLQDNGRLALEVMSQTIVHGGYKAFPTGNIKPNSLITSSVTSTTCDDGEESVLAPNLFSADSTKNGLDNESDTVGITYLGDNFVFTDCNGDDLADECRISNTNQNSDGASIYSAFFVDNNDRTLKCAGSRSTTAAIVADGIENLQVLYGINIDADPEVDRYINADQVVGTFIDNIVSVQIAVLVRSTRPTKKQAESIEYTLLDKIIPSPEDRFMRAVFTRTVNLRNTL